MTTPHVTEIRRHGSDHIHASHTAPTQNPTERHLVHAKNYIEIAHAVKLERDLQAAYDDPASAEDAINDVAVALAVVFHNDNPRFSAERFFLAANVPVHRLQQYRERIK